MTHLKSHSKYRSPTRARPPLLYPASRRKRKFLEENLLNHFQQSGGSYTFSEPQFAYLYNGGLEEINMMTLTQSSKFPYCSHGPQQDPSTLIPHLSA